MLRLTGLSPSARWPKARLALNELGDCCPLTVASRWFELTDNRRRPYPFQRIDQRGFCAWNGRFRPLTLVGGRMAITCDPFSAPWETGYMIKSISHDMRSFDFGCGSPLPGQPQFVSSTFKNGVLIVELAGPTVGTREAPIIAQEVNIELDANVDSIRTLLVDFTNVTVLTSVGLEMCINLRNKAHAAGANTVICGVNAQLDELMQMMKTDRLWQVAHDGEELSRALAA